MKIIDSGFTNINAIDIADNWFDNRIVIYHRKLKNELAAVSISNNLNGSIIDIQSSVSDITTNVLRQADVNSGDTIYEIRYDYNLNGETIVIPVNCTLMFNGGSISNGTLIGSNTKIDSKSKNKIFSTDIIFEGSFNTDKVTPEMFGAKTVIARPEDSSRIANLSNAEIESLPDSSDAINCAIRLSSISGSYVEIGGGYYKTLKTIIGLRQSVIKILPNNIIFYYSEGRGRKVCTLHEEKNNDITVEDRSEQVLTLLPNQFIYTDDMNIALNADPVLCKIEGLGTISVAKSKYSIAYYCRGTSYEIYDMSYCSPDASIRTTAGVDSTLAPDTRDIIGNGVPDISLGVHNQYYMDKLTKKYFRKYGTEWNTPNWSGVPDNADSRYNTNIRLEVSFSDARLINSQMNVRCMYGFRGIEILVINNGWFNDSKWKGSISNIHGSFVSIFNQYDFAGKHDMSELTHQIDYTIGYDCRIIYANKCSGVCFGRTWDLNWIGARRGGTKYELGKYVTKCTIEVDKLLYLTDRGSDNSNNFISAKNIPSGLIFVHYKNWYKNRIPYSMGDAYPNSSIRSDVKTLFEFDRIIERSDLNAGYNVYGANHNPEKSVPAVMFDDDDTTFYRAIDTKNNLYACHFPLMWSDNGGTTPFIKNSNVFIEIEYSIYGELSIYETTSFPDNIFVYVNQNSGFGSSDYTPLGDVSLLRHELGSAFGWGDVRRKNKKIIPIDGQKKATLDIAFFISNLDYADVTLDIYAIRYWSDGGSVQMQPIEYGTTAQRPTAVKKGFVYENTELGITEINKGNSSNPSWQQLPTISEGTWSITTSATLEQANGVFHKVGKSVTIAASLYFTGANVETNVQLPFAPKYGGIYDFGNLRVVLQRGNLTAKVSVKTVEWSWIDFNLTYKAI
ncbi:hypothetical protein ACR782_09300 [Sphingobacterium spiritivorum]|uniref:hypothetical protein n=1 Tax=Sphingobacterium spiritivorum TaxID=258 RepID=UPI003DA6970B